MATLPDIDDVKDAYKEQLKRYQIAEKEREKYISQRQQLEAQKTENELVKQELDLLEPGTNVFKLVGPALVKQDLIESRNTITKRLEYIEEEIKRCEKNLDGSVKKIQSTKDDVDKALKAVQAKLGKAS
uniref:Prefoldin subunit 6 n=1 Tax=Panagrolaimus sp. JU765 TaxID=591449 RepID=A0AC34RJM0_9BILA